MQLLFWCQREVWINVMCHPVKHLVLWVQSGAATYRNGFVICFLNVPPAWQLVFSPIGCANLRKYLANSYWLVAARNSLKLIMRLGLKWVASPKLVEKESPKRVIYNQFAMRQFALHLRNFCRSMPFIWERRFAVVAGDKTPVTSAAVSDFIASLKTPFPMEKWLKLLLLGCVIP